MKGWSPIRIYSLFFLLFVFLFFLVFFSHFPLIHQKNPTICNLCYWEGTKGTQFHTILFHVVFFTVDWLSFYCWKFYFFSSTTGNPFSNWKVFFWNLISVPSCSASILCVWLQIICKTFPFYLRFWIISWLRVSALYRFPFAKKSQKIRKWKCWYTSRVLLWQWMELEKIVIVWPL